MKNFKKNVIPMQQIGFPIQVPFIPKENDPVRLLFEVTEGLDFTDLYKTYSTLGRNPAIDPAILFKILIRDEHNWSFKKWILIRDEKIGKLGLLVIKWPKKGQTIPMRIIKCKILGC